MSTADPNSRPDQPKLSTKVLLGALVLASLLVTLVIAALLVDVAKKQNEAEVPYFQAVEITDDTVDPAVWGKNFPIQYEMFKKTTEMEPTEHGGSEGVPHTPTATDPRTVVPRQELEREPRLVKVWAGYARPITAPIAIASADRTIVFMVRFCFTKPTSPPPAISHLPFLPAGGPSCSGGARHGTQ